ncbi:peptidoglycan-binding protein [Streptomyces sp. NPDC059816]|uniref:peptidoglycan-binding protein n=1 Tax=Streptomyces sp. NPDC059816 TaxID=3346960 RepID=UPI00364D1DF7
MLRRWWEAAGEPPGRVRPTQQALAARLGVDQTTLSRYLNPNHPAVAPVRVVETLHTQLRAPGGELDRARELCRGALRENTRHQAVNGTSPVQCADSADPLGNRRASGRSRWLRLRPVLVVMAVVVSFAAGMALQGQLTDRDRTTVVSGGAGPAASATGASSQWPLMRIGGQDQFTAGRALQHLLNAHGYDVRVDGFFGRGTQEAVMDFQRSRDLPPDGKVGDQTWPELVKVVGPGSKPFEVRAAQELLHNTGQGGTPVSGRFTAATVEDVKHFQRSQRLPVTGLVGVDTWLALLRNQRPPVRAPAYQQSGSPLPSAPA